MKNLFKVAVVGSAFMPFMALANSGVGSKTVNTVSSKTVNTFIGSGPDVFGLINVFDSIVRTLLPVVIGLAVLVILWGVFNYISGAGDEEKRAQAKQYIIWGIIGLFVMVSVWGLVNVLKNTLKLDNTGPVINSGKLVPTCPTGSWNASLNRCN